MYPTLQCGLWLQKQHFTPQVGNYTGVSRIARNGGDTADLFFVILLFTPKSVPSNDYKYKEKKINSRNQRIQNE